MASSSSAIAGPSTAPASGRPDRLYVGNLAASVDEYTLIQVFQKFGKITKLDYMFHKSGPLKGKPRGYAFVEFGNKDDALQAMVKLHDRLFRGRKLVVTFASTAPPSDLPPPTKGRRPHEAPKTTTLSLLKKKPKVQSAAAQIAAMEAKLAMMEKKKPKDEDYVPGRGQYRDSPYGSPGPVGTSQDLEPGQMDQAMQEEPLGQVAALLAADDLEREMAAELGVERLGQLSSPTTTEAPVPTDLTSPAPAQILSDQASTPVSAKLDSMGLPPRPSTATQPATQKPAPIEASTTTSDTFKRGLAGLPKRPDFL